MANWTNYAENKLTDMVRGQGLALPSVWYIAPLSAADDASVTEITGSGIARAAISRTLTNWSGTQGPGTTLASTGTSHITSNNVAINMGTAAGSFGTVTHIGLWDASSGGNCWVWSPIEDSIVTAAAVVVSMPINSVAFTMGLSGGMSNYLSNKMIDKFFRGEVYTWPASMWLKAFTAAPTNAGGGTEVGGGVGYGRKEIIGSLANWSGTQSVGSVTASSGTAGRSSNNVQVAFDDPSGTWGDIGWSGLDDASTAGNPLFWAALTAAKSIHIGVPLVFAANSIGITWA